MFVTARTAEWRELVGELADALRTVGVDAAATDEALVVDGMTLVPHIAERAHPNPADLRDLVVTARDGSGLVIADRLSEAGRDVLRGAGWGWLDRRGHLRIWRPGLRVETPLPGRDRRKQAKPTNAWTPVGLEVALAALIEPDEAVTARRLAPRIGRSVSATHDSIARFSEVGLIGPRTHLPLLPDLFWEASAHWPDDGWIALPLPIEEVAERVGSDGLVRVDERAATLGGARIPAAGELPARCYVQSPGLLRRVRALVDRDEPVRCWVRPAPIEWIPLNEEHPIDEDHPWAVAHPVLCALRLAADPARGREVVEGWGILPGVGA
ncbi:MAG: hypothetical protein KDB02_06680 [Acidimicrobiales bacterium]|nr:hypothetical protein [Acidimicrobiales bacterium]